ncbi:hypothetical protein PoB_001577900 [Plakobranchus ocellatus]|uniref:Sulfotransferase domain-containing protein n=1 Tax=Plakobranchus ocellatus TaxID=259542 RepID=A0AAV3Z5J6_9GAST|nr:hypothetical protein PoB_001577900 [Plakobranchus ocellatus]
MFQETADEMWKSGDTNLITGDATVMDMWDFRGWTQIPQNHRLQEPEVLTPDLLNYIHKTPPKFLIQLREPVERLYSDYVFLDYGKTPNEFHQHVREAVLMMNRCLMENSTRVCYFSPDLYHRLPVRIHLGCYSVFLKEWFKVFPRSAFHVTTMDEFSSDMALTLERVMEFLGLEKLPDTQMETILKSRRRNVTKNKRGQILPETRKLLEDFYRKCSEETAELLGDDKFLWTAKTQY